MVVVNVYFLIPDRTIPFNIQLGSNPAFSYIDMLALSEVRVVGGNTPHGVEIEGFAVFSVFDYNKFSKSKKTYKVTFIKIIPSILYFSNIFLTSLLTINAISQFFGLNMCTITFDSSIISLMNECLGNGG